jgi:hypothetical protein
VSSARKDEPAASGFLRVKHAQGPASSQRLLRVKGARAGRARREVSAQYEWRSAEEFEDGQVRQAGLTQKLPSQALKEAERSGSYNLKRFEHPYEGNCTARHRARTNSGTSNMRRTLRLCAHLIGYAQGEKGVFETLTQGRGGVY